MSWSAAPEAPERKYGPSWTEAATGNQGPQKGSWFALLEKVGDLEGVGVLSALVAPHIATQGALDSSGDLSVDLVIRAWRDAVFSAAGRSFPEGFETEALTAYFTGGGGLSFGLNDGLSAIASGQYPARLSAGGSLIAEITGGISYPDGLSAIAVGQILIPAYFASEAHLLAEIRQIQAALAGLTAGGTLTASAVGTGAVEVLAELLGSGTISAAAFERYIRTLGISDDFNRANSTISAGPEWTNRFGTVGVLNNAAYPISLSQWCQATHDTPMSSDDMEVSVIIGVNTGSNNTSVLLGANTVGQCVSASSAAASTIISTQASWGYTGNVTRATAPSVTFTVGDELKLRRVGNVYTVFKNDADIGLSWPDTGNVVPRDYLHRLVGIATHNNNGLYRVIDGFRARDLGAPSGAGALTAALIASYQRAASGGGTGTMAATAYPRYLVSAGASGTGSLSATATIAFNPFTETNTNRTNQPVPVGTSGCWVTLIGGGAPGGTGRGAAFANNGGGGGGGGGGVLARSFIPVAQLGATYSVVKGGAAQASSFSSGGKSVTANAGGAGTNGGTSGAAAGGPGGTVSVVGFTSLSTFTGGVGGKGGTAGGNNGTAGANQTNTTAGGGGGAGRGSAGQTASGGKGGNSATANGGSANGGDGAAASAGNPGGGGGGGQSTNATGGSGGDGGAYGAGGGGGGGGNSTGPAGPGSAGGSIVEWI